MSGSPRNNASPFDAETLARINKVIELMRPAVQADGGDVEFVEATPDGTVYVRFHGACIGCPSSDITLQLGIERNLRHHVPEVRQVCVRD